MTFLLIIILKILGLIKISIRCVSETAILQYWSKTIIQLERNDEFNKRVATLKRHRSMGEGKPVSYTHLDVYKRQVSDIKVGEDAVISSAVPEITSGVVSVTVGDSIYNVAVVDEMCIRDRCGRCSCFKHD